MTVVVVVCWIQGLTGLVDDDLLRRAHFCGGKQMTSVMPVRTTTATPADSPAMRPCEVWLCWGCWGGLLLLLLSSCRYWRAAAEATAGHVPSIAHQTVAHHIIMTVSNEEQWCFPMSAWGGGHDEPAPTTTKIVTLDEQISRWRAK